jgi:hypothetical protein
MRHALLVFAMVGLAAPASPCSVVGPLPLAERLVGDADVIALVRAEGAFDDMPVVAYIQNDEADEDLAPFGPEAGPLGGLEQGRLERLSE